MNANRTLRTAWLLGATIVLGVAAGASAQTYDPIQAGEDAYQAGEKQRLAAIDQQRALAEQIRRQNARAAAQGYAATPYGYIYNPRRAFRQSLRSSYPSALQPRALVDIYGYPYSGYARGPVGQGKDATRSSGYTDRPPPQPQAPTPAPSESRPQPPPPPSEPMPESIPAPPSEPGPREF